MIIADDDDIVLKRTTVSVKVEHTKFRISPVPYVFTAATPILYVTPLSSVSIIYAVFCYLLGWWWLNKGMQEAETEVTNRYNPFVKEMRRYYNKQNI